MPEYTLLARYGGGYSVFDKDKNELSFSLSSTDALREAGVDRSKAIVKEMAETENGWEPN